MHTLQSMFDAVATHAMQMETQCLSTEGCRYRSRNAPAGSDRCFIGALISDDRYNPDLENAPADTSDVLEAALIPWFLKNQAVELQQIHDGARCWLLPAELRDSFKEGLVYFARAHGLTLPEVLR